MIFEDFSKKRWKRARLIFIGIAILAAVLLGGMITSFLVSPPLPSVRERQNNIAKALNIKANIINQDKKTKPKKAKKPLPPQTTAPISANQNQNLGTDHFLSSAFLVQDDPDSLES